jgi:hypothetical protein
VSLNSKTDKRDPVKKTELSHWEGLLKWELAQLPNLKYIVLLGGYALRAFTGDDDGVTNWRGSVLDVKIGDRDVKALVTFNPAHVMREARMDVVFRMDLAKLEMYAMARSRNRRSKLSSIHPFTTHISGSIRCTMRVYRLEGISRLSLVRLLVSDLVTILTRPCVLIGETGTVIDIHLMRRDNLGVDYNDYLRILKSDSCSRMGCSIPTLCGSRIELEFVRYGSTLCLHIIPYTLVYHTALLFSQVSTQITHIIRTRRTRGMKEETSTRFGSTTAKTYVSCFRRNKG